MSTKWRIRLTERSESLRADAWLRAESRGDPKIEALTDSIFSAVLMGWQTPVLCLITFLVCHPCNNWYHVCGSACRGYNQRCSLHNGDWPDGEQNFRHAFRMRSLWPHYKPYSLNGMLLKKEAMMPHPLWLLHLISPSHFSGVNQLHIKQLLNFVYLYQ